MRIFFFILTSLIAFVGQAKSIRPVLLQELIQQSKYIVIALVDNPKNIYYDYFINAKGDTTLKYEVFKEDTATLRIIQVLKGDNEKILQVVFNPHIICPGAAEFRDKGIVIAFLNEIDSSNLCYPNFGAWGEIIIRDSSQLLTYKNRILEYIEISKKSPNKKHLIEWKVKCLESPWTRAEAVRDLRKDVLKNGRPDKTYLSKEFYRHLNANQKERLTKAFFKSDSIDYEEILLIDYVSKKDYPRLAPFLLEKLEQSTWKYSIMEKYVELFPSDTLLAITNEYGQLRGNDSKKETLYQNFISVARQESKHWH